MDNENKLPMERVLYEVKKIIVGQDHLLESMIVALLARGHILVEGVPGLAKTMAIKTLADSIGGEFKRIQFTPDLVPADLIGTRIYNRKLNGTLAEGKATPIGVAIHSDHTIGRFHHVSMGYTLGVGADGDIKAAKQ